MRTISSLLFPQDIKIKSNETTRMTAEVFRALKRGKLDATGKKFQ